MHKRTFLAATKACHHVFDAKFVWRKRGSAQRLVAVSSRIAPAGAWSYQGCRRPLGLPSQRTTLFGRLVKRSGSVLSKKTVRTFVANVVCWFRLGWFLHQLKQKHSSDEITIFAPDEAITFDQLA
jgi:hypothetical protein